MRSRQLTVFTGLGCLFAAVPGGVGVIPLVFFVLLPHVLRCYLLHFRSGRAGTRRNMAGFILGTGSGVLAAAMTYYTLSTHLTRETVGVTEQCVLHCYLWLSKGIAGC